jgi:hypothetical protein
MLFLLIAWLDKFKRKESPPSYPTFVDQTTWASGELQIAMSPRLPQTGSELRDYTTADY